MRACTPTTIPARAGAALVRAFTAAAMAVFLFAVAATPQRAEAQTACPIISQAVTSRQSVADGATCEITASGSITTNDVRGALVGGLFENNYDKVDNATVTMRGSITNNNGGWGVLLNGTGNRFTNYGSVTSDNRFASAVSIGEDGDSNSLSSNGVVLNEAGGTITSNSGDSASGVYMRGDGHRLENRGTISARGNHRSATANAQSHAVEQRGGNNTIINEGAGSITTTGNLAAIRQHAGGNLPNTIIVRGGSITGMHNDADGIFQSGDNATITISGGTVSGGRDGIRLDGNNATITINGTVQGGGGHAINITSGSGHTVVLGADARIIGTMNIPLGTTVTDNRAQMPGAGLPVEVSNLGAGTGAAIAGEASNSERRISTGFTIGGTNADYFAISDVTVPVNSVNGSPAALGVAIHAAQTVPPPPQFPNDPSAQAPMGPALITFPARVVAAGEHVFTAPAESFLQGGTTYALVVSAPGSTGNANYQVRVDSNNADSGSGGWSIDDARVDSSDGGATWSSGFIGGSSLVFRVRAFNFFSAACTPPYQICLRLPTATAQSIADGVTMAISGTGSVSTGGLNAVTGGAGSTLRLEAGGVITARPSGNNISGFAVQQANGDNTLINAGRISLENDAGTFRGGRAFASRLYAVQLGGNNNLVRNVRGGEIITHGGQSSSVHITGGTGNRIINEEGARIHGDGTQSHPGGAGNAGNTGVSGGSDNQANDPNSLRGANRTTLINAGEIISEGPGGCCVDGSRAPAVQFLSTDSTYTNTATGVIRAATGARGDGFHIRGRRNVVLNSGLIDTLGTGPGGLGSTGDAGIHIQGNDNRVSVLRGGRVFAAGNGVLVLRHGNSNSAGERNQVTVADGATVQARGDAIYAEVGGTFTLRNAGNISVASSGSHRRIAFNSGPNVVHFRGDGSSITNLSGGVLSTGPEGNMPASSAAHRMNVLYFTGDNNRVHNQAGAAIRSSANNSGGIYWEGNDNVVTNDGDIILTGGGDGFLGSSGENNTPHGMRIAGHRNTITNASAASITVTGRAGMGMILRSSDDNVVVNHGTIRGTGEGVTGIRMRFGNRNRITNARGGTISMDGTGAGGNTGGIYLSSSESARVTNHGTVRTASDGSNAVHITGNNHTVINTGSITATGANAHGIRTADNGHTVLVLGGSISGAGDGIRVEGDNGSIVIAAATITAGTGHAINIMGTGNTLALLQGSRFTCASDTITVAAGNNCIVETAQQGNARMSDVDLDGAITANDAMALYTALTVSDAQARARLLAGALGGADVQGAVTRAQSWAAQNAADLNGDGATNASDALVLYYAEVMADSVGDGSTGGAAHWRRTLLGGLAPGGAGASDAVLRTMLTEANALRNTRLLTATQ